jgi:hypothetical protein
VRSSAPAKRSRLGTLRRDCSRRHRDWILLGMRHSFNNTLYPGVRNSVSRSRLKTRDIRSAEISSPLRATSASATSSALRTTLTYACRSASLAGCCNMCSNNAVAMSSHQRVMGGRNTADTPLSLSASCCIGLSALKTARKRSRAHPDCCGRRDSLPVSFPTEKFGRSARAQTIFCLSLHFLITGLPDKFT